MATLSTPTLQNLLTKVRTLLNQRDPLNSFWTDIELADYINEGIRLYFLECVMDNQGYFTTTSNLNIVANTEIVALPVDCFEVRNLWKTVQNGYAILSYDNSNDSSYSTQGGTNSETYIPRYKFRGANLVLYPTPNFSETSGLKLEYIQFPDQMIWGGDSLSNQISPVFKQLVEMYAVYKAKLKESMVQNGNMHEVPAQNLESLYKIFKDALAKRSKNPTYVEPFNPEII